MSKNSHSEFFDTGQHFRKGIFAYARLTQISSFFLIAATHWFIGTDLLLNKSFPIIFNSIDGNESKCGTSFYNDAEIDAVLVYVEKLLRSEWNNRPVFLDNIGN